MVAVAVSTMADPTVKGPKKRGGKSFFGRQLSERTSVSSDTHRAKRERAQTERARERRVSFSSPCGLKCRAALPVPCASAPGPESISLAHPPSPFSRCAKKRHCKCECASTVFHFRYPRRHGLAVLTALYEVTILAVGYDDSPFTYGFTWTWDRLLAYFLTFSISFPPASLSLPALFQTLRRYPYRLLRQRVQFSTPSRVIVTSDLVGSGRRWSRSPVAGMLTSRRRRLVEPEHCARRCVQCHHKS